VPSDSRPHIILIDGHSGVGKTTLSNEMARWLDATVVHLDDVYPGWGGLVEGRNSVINGVLEPLHSGRTGSVMSWDWTQDAPSETLVVAPSSFVIVEGCGISTPESRILADTVVWVEAARHVRAARIAQRDGAEHLDLFEAWERDVNTHIAANDPIATATVVVVR